MYTSLPQTEAILPEDFTPGTNHVIIGRGKKCSEHSGNVQLRQIVRSRLEEYSQANTKAAKSDILASIVQQIHAVGGFVREDAATGRWMTVGTFLAREKTSQTFRDILSDGYKSSKASKKKRRQEQLQTADVLARVETPSLKRRRCESGPVAVIDEFDFDTIFDNSESESESESDDLEPLPLSAAENDFFSEISVVSLEDDENDFVDPFEPMPLVEADLFNVFEEKPFSMEMFDMDLSSKFQKSLSTFEMPSFEFPKFVPSRNVATARTA